MGYITVAEAARLWGVSERTVRGYCAGGRIPGAELIGKTWAIPEDAERPGRRQRTRTKPRALLDVLREERAAGTPGGIYHHVQVEFAYNSNHIEGSRLTYKQTRLIFETNTIGVMDAVRVDDILEAANHFRCVDTIIDVANRRLTERGRELEGSLEEAKQQLELTGDAKAPVMFVMDIPNPYEDAGMDKCPGNQSGNSASPKEHDGH